MTTQVRFQKRIKIFPGVHLNFGKRGFMSVTLGTRWVSVNIGRGGWYLNGSLVGTGLRVRKRLDRQNKPTKPESRQ
ncbi:DUF4236 domain-containing protein [Vibrio parahaemolyticus]|uniref:DUF4236 domain-containing protein n=1 Tax=Vibrio parahaemolyticus TaxID=670 RepID=UPI00111D3354|nr:DUF4236 domain-containing protein [Vibrio parahaemolyticus]TOP83771.1 hypothetical protein CGH08_20865 [Vibrio parahaemolyticus]TOQ29774.1 hypothetical protein CGG99_09240 [Vibrio parahaemolyticus]